MWGQGALLGEPEELAGHAQVHTPATGCAPAWSFEIGQEVFAAAVPLAHTKAPKGPAEGGRVFGAGDGTGPEHFDAVDQKTACLLLKAPSNGFNLRKLGHARIVGLARTQALTSSLSAKLLVLMPPSEPL